MDSVRAGSATCAQSVCSNAKGLRCGHRAAISSHVSQITRDCGYHCRHEARRRGGAGFRRKRPGSSDLDEAYAGGSEPFLRADDGRQASRDKIVLKDKARNMKYDFLKAWCSTFEL